MSDPQYEAYLREGDQREENLRLRAEIERLRDLVRDKDHTAAQRLLEIERLRALIGELRWAVLHLANSGDGSDERIVDALRAADKIAGIKVERPQLPKEGTPTGAIEAVLLAGRRALEEK